jgi:2-methylcitrate dehydratase PrpD
VYDDPRTGLEGKFSAQYPVASLLLDGKLDLQSFTDEAVQRAAVRAMMKKIERYRVEDTQVYSGTVGYTDVTIRAQGSEFSRRVNKGPGSRLWPMSMQEHQEKFFSCARVRMSECEAKHLLDVVLAFEALGDVRLFTALTVPQ